MGEREGDLLFCFDVRFELVRGQRIVGRDGGRREEQRRRGRCRRAGYLHRCCFAFDDLAGANQVLKMLRIRVA